MSKIQQAEKTLRYATAALAMGLVRDDTPREMIVRLALGARAALERVEALTVPACFRGARIHTGSSNAPNLKDLEISQRRIAKILGTKTTVSTPRGDSFGAGSDEITCPACSGVGRVGTERGLRGRACPACSTNLMLVTVWARELAECRSAIKFMRECCKCERRERAYWDFVEARENMRLVRVAMKAGAR